MMDAEELVKMNNSKRKKLNDANLAYYEDMLVYIRLSYDKSEQETEEVLAEMLDHLIEAQADGKTAEEVFGSKPKQYANQIIGELPKMVTKKRLKLFVMGMLYFLAVGATCYGLSGLVMHYGFHIGQLHRSIYTGSVITETVLSVIAALVMVYLLILFLRWSCFKKMNKVLEFLLLWMISMASIGVFFVIYYFMPSFGSEMLIPLYAILSLDIILFPLGYLSYKMI